MEAHAPHATHPPHGLHGPPLSAFEQQPVPPEILAARERQAEATGNIERHRTAGDLAEVGDDASYADKIKASNITGAERAAQEHAELEEAHAIVDEAHLMKTLPYPKPEPPQPPESVPDREEAPPVPSPNVSVEYRELPDRAPLEEDWGDDTCLGALVVGQVDPATWKMTATLLKNDVVEGEVAPPNDFNEHINSVNGVEGEAPLQVTAPSSEQIAVLQQKTEAAVAPAAALEHSKEIAAEQKELNEDSSAQGPQLKWSCALPLVLLPVVKTPKYSFL